MNIPTVELSTEEQIEARVNTGILNYWYPVLPGWSVNGTPKGITRLSQKIVIWRDSDGKVHALEDRCPHRGARLSLGWNLGDKIACWYHGVQIGSDGKVVDVPAEEGCPMAGEAHIKSYPVVESNDAIFLWFGDELNTEPAEFQLPEYLTGDEYSAFVCVSKWNCNYRYALENVMDPMHGAYLHSTSHSMAEGDKTAVMRIRNTEKGYVFEKSGQTGVNFDWCELQDGSVLTMHLSIPYGPGSGPGGDFYIVGAVTPVDEHHCMPFFWRIRKTSGWQCDVWRFMYRNKLEQLHWDVLEQDRLILEPMSDDARDHEYLYSHDVGLSRLRKILAKKAKVQLSNVAAGHQ